MAAEKTFLIADKARTLLQYTVHNTKVTVNDVERTDARKLFEKIAAANSLEEAKRACEICIGVLDHKSCKGFTKAAYRRYGEDMREIAKQIVRDTHAANNRFFRHEYDERLRSINAIMDDCSLLLEYIRLCLDEKIITAKKAGEWTVKVRDVKNMAAAWAKGDSARAEKYRDEDEQKETMRQADVYKAAMLAALRQIEREKQNTDTGV